MSLVLKTDLITQGIIFIILIVLLKSRVFILTDRNENIIFVFLLQNAFPFTIARECLEVEWMALYEKNDALKHQTIYRPTKQHGVVYLHFTSVCYNLIADMNNNVEMYCC